MKNKNNKNISIPSTAKDIIWALIFSLLVLLLYFIIYYIFGNPGKPSVVATPFMGAVIAFTGLMVKQYHFKETVEYLHKWNHLNQILEEIFSKDSSDSLPLQQLQKSLSNLNLLSISYVKYLKTELKTYPYVPVALVTLYGIALLACDSILVKAICLWIMFWVVSFLTKATVTANNLAIEQSNVDELINLYEGILNSFDEEAPINSPG